MSSKFHKPEDPIGGETEEEIASTEPIVMAARIIARALDRLRQDLCGIRGEQGGGSIDYIGRAIYNHTEDFIRLPSAIDDVAEAIREHGKPKPPPAPKSSPKEPRPKKPRRST